ncbi:MAG: hypothetical protein K2G60_00510, partial [Oscillospiraceae bacterium]|nr:hypothetical protein [Oscillospiraceae bacterium]
VFLDALKYTGYDVSQFTVNGKSGANVTKRSKIGYNASGATGLEMSGGKPNISAFENSGMCCASYATYVYFNYLPNVYGLDTSFLAKPSNGRSTAAWYTACEKWVKDGVAKKTVINKSCSSANNLTALQNIAIGSLLIFTDNNGDYSHTGIYAGTKNGNYYQTQVGNSRGPEVQLINGFFSGPSSYANLLAAYTPKLPEAKGKVGVQKVDDAGNAVSGAKIGVYSDKACTDKIATLTTDSSGKAVCPDNFDEGTVVYFKEISAPTGYDLSTQIVSAKVVKDKITYASVNIVDNRQGKITVTKYNDSGDKLGAGYVFGVYSDKACTSQVTKLTTGTTGSATSNYLSAGTYYVKEIALPDTDTIHELKTSVYIVNVEKGKTVEVNNGKVINNRKRGDAEVIKVSEDGIIEGMEFKLYGVSDSGETVSMIAKTDANGRVEFKNVLIGTYTIEEINTPDRYVTPKAQTITVESDKVAKVTFSNVLKRLALQITKIDAETGKTILYAGAGFQIFDANSNLVLIDNKDTFYTDATGTINTSKALAYGKYTLVEVEAPYGYVLDATPTAFEVNSKTIETVDGIQLVKVVKSDRAQKGTITIAKNGEAFSTVVEENGSYKPVFALKNLSNATYEIAAAEDIITADGSVRAKQGTVVATLTTSDNGVVTSAPLYLGKYTVTEVKAPEGYVLNTEPVTVEIAYAGQNIDIAVQYVSFTNDRQKIKIDLVKTLENDEVFGIGMNNEILDVQFALYAAEDIIAEDGTVIPADGLIEIASCDESGKLTFSTDVPFGQYYVREYSTSEKYIISDTKYPINFIYDGQDKSVVSIVVNEGVDITNKIIRGTIVGQKIDEDGNSVPNALFGLFLADVNFTDADYTEENAIMIATSNEIGEFFFKNVPYGTWIVRELKAAEGYILNNQNYFVTVTENESLVEVVIENTFIKGSVKVSKVDSKNTDKLLSNAVFEIYIDADGDKGLNAAVAVLIGALTEPSMGIDPRDELRYGGYFIHEKTAPEGYTKSDEYVYFEIVEDGSVIEITATNDKIIVPEIPNTDGENDKKVKRVNNINLAITLLGAPFILGIGYFIVLKPKLKNKKGKKKNKK